MQVLAAGTSIPDAMESIIVARKGMVRVTTFAFL